MKRLLLLLACLAACASSTTAPTPHVPPPTKCSDCHFIVIRKDTIRPDTTRP